MLSWDSNSPKSQLWLTVLTCFGAGVILTTTVTHMMPEVSHFIRYNIEHGIQGFRHEREKAVVICKLSFRLRETL